MRIVVAGARGQLGAAVVRECAPAHEVVPLARADLDIADDRAVAASIDPLRPDAIVNCAADNRVDYAEDHPIEALNVNAFGVRALAQAARRSGATLVHYSTDFVFDGTAAVYYLRQVWSSLSPEQRKVAHDVMVGTGARAMQRGSNGTSVADSCCCDPVKRPGPQPCPQ